MINLVERGRDLNFLKYQNDHIQLAFGNNIVKPV